MASGTRAPSTIITINLTGQTEFNIPFEYLARKFVIVTLLGVDRKVLTLNTDYRFVGKTIISLANPTPAGYTQLEIRRETSATERLVDYHDGSILRAYDLNLSQIQTLHVAEEARDIVALVIGVDDTGNLDARGRRIVNVASGVLPSDAVNLKQLQENIGGLLPDDLAVTASGSTHERYLNDRFADIPNVRDFGAVCDGVTDDTDAILRALAVHAKVAVTGVALIRKGELDLRKLTGNGSIKILDAVLPVGDVMAPLTINVPTTFGLREVFSDYLSTRRLFAQVTLAVQSGTHTVDMTSGGNIQYEHIDGGMISLIGTGSSSCTLKFDFTGRSASRLYAIGLDGGYTFRKVDGITFDGNNYSGHADGGPTLGNGNAADPIGCKVQNGGNIEFGPDVVFTHFARNGFLINEGSYCLANGVTVNNCGSDAFVASIGSTLYVQNAKCDTIYGDGLYADRGGNVFGYGVVMTNIKKRFSGSAGDGIVAVECGSVYCNNAKLDSIEDVGLYAGTGGRIIGSGIKIGSVSSGCSGFCAHALTGGYIAAANLSIANSTNTLLNVEAGGTINSVGATLTGGTGVKVMAGGTLNADDAKILQGSGTGLLVEGGVVNATRLTVEDWASNIVLTNGTLNASGLRSRRSASHGLLAQQGSTARITTATIENSGGDGINCSCSTVAAGSKSVITGSTGFGASSRLGGTVDLRGATLENNAKGVASPTLDTSTGINQSVIFGG